MSDKRFASSQALGGGTGAGDPLRRLEEAIAPYLEEHDAAARLLGFAARPDSKCICRRCNTVRDALSELRNALVSSPHGWQHAATMLAKSLPDGVLEEMREVWGNTNVAVIKHWRDQVLPLEARETPEEKP